MKALAVLPIAFVSILPLFGNQPAPTPSQASFEQRFLQSMIEHHTMAVEMSRVCVAKPNVRVELKGLCQTIIDDQLREIQMMKNWLQSWYGVSYTPKMGNGNMQSMRKLAALSGDTFAAEFMLEMIDHHAMAVMDGVDCLQRAYHKEMLQMCADMIAAQGKEILQMRVWLMDWYNITSAKGHGSRMGMGMGMGMGH